MAEARITFHPERRGAGTTRLTETHWGCVVSEVRDGVALGALAEHALRYVGVFLVILGYVTLLFPAEPQVFLAAAFLANGAWLYLFGGLGFQRDVDVDTSAREYRLVRRNCRGDRKTTERFGFDEVASVGVEHGRAGRAALSLELESGKTMRLLKGASRDLNLLHARLTRDMVSPADRVEARLLREAPRRIGVISPLRKTA